MMVVPTKFMPRRFRSLEMRSESSVCVCGVSSVFKMERSLAERIDLAWSKYETSLRSLPSSEIMGQIEDVSAVWMCRNALLQDMELYSDEQLTFLLSLFDPLEQMKDHLVQEQEADQMEQVNSAIRSLQKEFQEEQRIDTPGQGEMTMK